MSAFLFVPVPKLVAQKVVSEAFSNMPWSPQLLPIPAEYRVPSDKHLVTVACHFDKLIRHELLPFEGPIRGCSVMVPFTSTGKSSTPFITPIVSYITAFTASDSAFLAVSLTEGVSPALNGITTFIGEVTPAGYPYRYDGVDSAGKKQYSANAKWDTRRNTVYGPGLYPPAVDFVFRPSPSPLPMSPPQMRKMVNQPYILGFPYNDEDLRTLTCQRNTYFTKRETADVQLREGKVIFGPGGQDGVDSFSDTLMNGSKDGSGEYYGAIGFSACAQLVGYNTGYGQECEAAARDVDSAAL